MTRANLTAAVPLCSRCGFVQAVKGTLCAHCDALTAYIRELTEQGLTMRDMSILLGLHERAVAAVCVCRVTERERLEHSRCPRHVLDVERRLRA